MADFDKPTTGWTRRTLRTGRIAASLGRRAAQAAVKRRLGMDDDADNEKTADAFERLAGEMDQMKGLVLKVGQMVSYLDGAVPERGQRVLRRLQRQAAPMPYERVEEQIIRHLGAPVEELFDHFEREPAAAASIGQVHRARIGDRELAVKVQYPGMLDTLDTDLANLRRMGALASVGMALSGRELVEELRQRMLEECDYEREAANQEHFRALLADEPRIVIPEVVTERCGPGVLTMAWIEGEAFYDFRERASQEDKDRVGELLFEVSFRSIFAHGAFNGDPHPGNVLILPDGRVALLDWGCVRYFTRDFIEAWKNIAGIMLREERDAFPAAFSKMGFSADPGKMDWDFQYESIGYLYEPMRDSQFRFSQEYVARSWDVLLWDNPNLRRIKMSPEWLLIQRLQWGLYSVLALLDAGGSFDVAFERWLGAPSVEGIPPAS